MMLVGLFVTVVGFSTGVFCLCDWLKANQPTNLSQSIHPAVMPFKGDQKSCETSGRVWEDESCLDYNYDPSF